MNAHSHPIAASLAGLKVIDVDTHWSEPPDLWTSRTPAAFRDRMPQRKVIDGASKWVMGDTVVSNHGASSCIAKDGSVAQDMSFTKWQVEDAHPGCSQVKPRVQLMDEQGVWAQIVYPNIMGFGGHKAMKIDPELRLLAAQIYNDALAEMQDESGQRLFGMAVLPWWDIKQAVAELERCAAMGMRGINLASSPHSHGLPDLGQSHWNPLWEACVKHDMPVNFHVGSSDESVSWYGAAAWPSLANSAKLAIGSITLFNDQMEMMSNFILSGNFDRFPQLKLVSVESGIGWIPFLFQALEYSVYRGPGYQDLKLELTPKEYVKRNVYSCFWFENVNLPELVRQVGEDNVMFETDFPHPTCLFPDGINRVYDALEGSDPALIRKIVSTNAARVYNIPL